MQLLLLFGVLWMVLGACAGVDPRGNNAKAASDSGVHSGGVPQGDRSAQPNSESTNQVGDGVPESTNAGARSREDEARSAYVSGDYARAAPLMYPFAEKGQVWAQFGLGMMYEAGEGVPQDRNHAETWYRKAAAQGDQRAQAKLEAMKQAKMNQAENQAKEDEAKVAYEKRDYTRAAILLRPLAEQGNIDAQIKLWWMYHEGKGVPQDDKEAAIWVRKAAEQGQAAWAQYNLGWMYEHGQGVPKNDQEAVGWFHKAAKQGEPNAQNHLGMMIRDGKGVASDKEKAKGWFRVAAERGHADAQKNLGLLLLDNDRSTLHKVDAMPWFRKAAEQGLAEAQYYLGAIYAAGYDTLYNGHQRPDYKEALLRSQ
jgi:TPR repeat protein